MKFNNVVKVIKKKQHFYITSPNFDRLVLRLRGFNEKNLTTYRMDSKYDRKLRRSVNNWVLDREFYLVNYEEREIRYIYHIYPQVLQILGELGYDVDVKAIEPVEGFSIKLKPAGGYTLRKDQELYTTRMVETKEPTMLIDLRTGGGKTLTVTKGLTLLGKRFGVLVLSRYIDKWKGDLEHYLGLTEDDYYVVQGGDSLRKLLAMNNEELSKIKGIIFSLGTIVRYLKDYFKRDKLFRYDIKPQDLTRHLNIGYMLNDETHQEFHNVFLTQLVFDSRLFIGITATLLNNNREIEDKYRLLFPKASRVQNDTVYERYIVVVSIKYLFDNFRRIRYQNKFGYSQVELEQSIMRNPRLLKGYLALVYKVYTVLYKKRMEDKDKCLIFAGTIDMCNLIVEYIEDIEKEIRICKYTQEDDYGVIKTNEVIVSTFGEKINLKKKFQREV